MRLITYGKTWDRAKLRPVRNSLICLRKPTGGLWASPVGAKYGWKYWCEENEFETKALEMWFEFTFVGRIYRINSVRDMNDLPWVPHPDAPDFEFIDFEFLMKDGYDAIHLTDHGETVTKWSIGPSLGHSLYGWDCESVLVMNPDSVTDVKAGQSREYAKIALQTLDKGVTL